MVTTVTKPIFRGSTLRDTTLCSVVMMCAATRIGSTLPCGSAPWPPLPITFSRAQSTDAIAGPSTKPKWPTGTPGQLCSP
ncbi:hypothetical protein G6F40_018227 [Rhizopus arrhizus]|nr:hypothetical protein G6F40_018227 [Rhizopus arrhizus]